MSIYYVSNDGCDNNDGLSPERAWQTISKVNSTHKSGDEIRFRRGDTFFGNIFSIQGISSEQPTIYTAYGEGKKPIISQLKTVKKGVWEKFKENVYRVDVFNANNITGNTVNQNKNVGYMEVDGTVFYEKKFDIEELNTQWDFYCDDYNKETPYVYVYSTASPDTLCKTLSLACDIHGIFFRDYIRVENLIFTGTGGCGICNAGRYSVVSHCEFHRIGGSCIVHYLPRFRYGNGVEMWAGSSDNTVEYCTFSEIYDVAMTMQGAPVYTSWENVRFHHNTVINCVQALEIWSGRKDQFEPDTGFKNCWFEYNTCINTGFCWGYEARPNKHSSAHLLMYDLFCPHCDIHVHSNLFYGAKVSSIYKQNGPQEIPNDYKIYNNTFVREKGQPIALPGSGTTAKQLEEFEAKIALNNQIIDMPNFKI